jgi:hypothetical protein
MSSSIFILPEKTFISTNPMTIHFFAKSHHPQYDNDDARAEPIIKSLLEHWYKYLIFKRNGVLFLFVEDRIYSQKD